MNRVVTRAPALEWKNARASPEESSRARASKTARPSAKRTSAFWDALTSTRSNGARDKGAHGYAPLEHRAVGVGDGASEEAVLHGTAVDEEVKPNGACPGPLRWSEVSLESHGASLAGALLEALFLDHVTDALAARGCA